MAETLIADAPYIAIASGGLSAIQSYMAGQQQSSMLRYQAQQQQNNADQARINAGAALSAGEADAARQQDQTRRRLAAGINQAAGSGVDPGFGSPLDLMADVAAEGALDVQIKRYKARAEADRYVQQGAGFDAQAAASGAAASEAASAGLWRAGTTVLGGFADYGRLRTRMGATYP